MLIPIFTNFIKLKIGRFLKMRSYFRIERVDHVVAYDPHH